MESYNRWPSCLLLSPSIPSSRLPRVVRILFLLKAVESSVVWLNHVLCICSSAGGHRAVAALAVVLLRMPVDRFAPVLQFFGCLSGSGIAGPRGNSIRPSEGSPHCSCSDCPILHPDQRGKVPVSPHPPQHAPIHLSHCAHDAWSSWV